jgi:hypothetical protein
MAVEGADVILTKRICHLNKIKEDAIISKVHDSGILPIVIGRQ